MAFHEITWLLQELFLQLSTWMTEMNLQIMLEFCTEKRLFRLTSSTHMLTLPTSDEAINFVF